jgi:hypothetical protein
LLEQQHETGKIAPPGLPRRILMDIDTLLLHASIFALRLARLGY